MFIWECVQKAASDLALFLWKKKITTVPKVSFTDNFYKFMYKTQHIKKEQQLVSLNMPNSISNKTKAEVSKRQMQRSADSPRSRNPVPGCCCARVWWAPPPPYWDLELLPHCWDWAKTRETVIPSASASDGICWRTTARTHSLQGSIKKIYQAFCLIIGEYRKSKCSRCLSRSEQKFCILWRTQNAVRPSGAQIQINLKRRSHREQQLLR